MTTETTDSLHSQYKVLIIDDEKDICDLLKTALESKYDVSTAYSAEQAFPLMETTTFDLIATDLKLPKKDGIDVLKYAKQKDEHTEVIIITGYASLDTATSAINLGASSYLIKPVSISNFIMHADKSIATRDFYLKTKHLMEHSDKLDMAIREHIANITQIYEFSRKVMLSLEIPEIVRILLNELNMKMNAFFSVIAIDLLGTAELYTMTHKVKTNPELLRGIMLKYWNQSFSILNRQDFLNKKSRFFLLQTEGNEPIDPNAVKPISTPIIILGKTIGSVAVFRPKDIPVTAGENQLIYILSSIVAPLIEHGYMHRRVRLLADTDPLTGVANHRSFHEILTREIARSNRHKESFCLCILDIDDFKKVNDTFGHLIGDAVLKDLTKRILKAIRIDDVLARYGGEEFAVILPHTDLKGAQVQAERIRKVIASTPFIFPDNEIPYTVSIGISMYSGSRPESKEELIKDADDALYRSKAAGKNTVSVK
jgi:diguanylate cyclase (GGDEF)-like protein